MCINKQFVITSARVHMQWCRWRVGRVGFSPPGNWDFSWPYYNQGADYAHHISASPPGFENPAASLNIEGKSRKNWWPKKLNQCWNGERGVKKSGKNGKPHLWTAPVYPQKIINLPESSQSLYFVEFSFFKFSL